jgi:AraC-like DNA-binding protein
VQNLILNLPLYFHIGSAFAFGLIFLLFAFKQQNRAEYITFLVQLIPRLFIILEMCNAWQFPGDIVSRYRFFGFMWNILSLVHLLFLHRMYEVKRKRIEFFLWSVFIVNTIVIVMSSDISQRRYGLIVIFTLTSLVLYDIFLHLQQLIRGNPYAKIMFTLGIIIAVSSAHDGLALSPMFLGPHFNILGYTFDTLTFPYASIAMFIGAGLIVVYRFITMTLVIEDLNENLEKKVDERTQELQKSLSDLSNAIEVSFMGQRLKNHRSYKTSITPHTEEKIKAAIIYINANFRDNVTREGLAAMQSITPDHLGKAFRKYTGKKINEYVNDLRIKEAMKLLWTTDRKIIDIAFSLGFESLSTFNRLFTKILKTPPRNFRKKNSILQYLPEE